jgi:hypothetical protein
VEAAHGGLHLGYHAFGAEGVARWGDYGAAHAEGNSIWVAKKWIDHHSNGSDLASWARV